VHFLKKQTQNLAKTITIGGINMVSLEAPHPTAVCVFWYVFFQNFKK